MPKYLFKFAGEPDDPEDEGAIFPDLASAEEAAVQLLAEEVADQPLQTMRDGALSVRVLDDQGRPLLAVRLALSVEKLQAEEGQGILSFPAFGDRRARRFKPQ